MPTHCGNRRAHHGQAGQAVGHEDHQSAADPLRRTASSVGVLKVTQFGQIAFAHIASSFGFGEPLPAALFSNNLHVLTEDGGSSPHLVRLAWQSQSTYGQNIKIGTQRTGDGCCHRHAPSADPKNCSVLAGISD